MVSYLPASLSQAPDSDRKMIRNSSMDLVTKNPADTSERIRQLAERLGGFPGEVSNQWTGCTGHILRGPRSHRTFRGGAG
jgi:hypothetical protein